MKETTLKINKTKSQFFEKIKLTNLQPDSSRKKETHQGKRGITSTKLEMKKERTTDNAEIQRIIRDYYE